MFSSRLDWTQRPNALSAALAARRQAGGEIVDLTESNPTRAGLPYGDVLRALVNERSLLYQPDPRGLLSAREAVSGYYGGRVNANRIRLKARKSQAES